MCIMVLFGIFYFNGWNSIFTFAKILITKGGKMQKCTSWNLYNIGDILLILNDIK